MTTHSTSRWKTQYPTNLDRRGLALVPQLNEGEAMTKIQKRGCRATLAIPNSDLVEVERGEINRIREKVRMTLRVEVGRGGLLVGVEEEVKVVEAVLLSGTSVGFERL